MKGTHLTKILLPILILLVLFAVPSNIFMNHVTIEVKAEPEVDWLELARIAWKYFQPGVGLSSRGLNYASISWHFLTDWDLGCYVSALVDADILGLVPREGPMGMDDRIRRVLNFLATRPLHPSGVPYGVYNADTGEPGTDGPSNPSDAGRLLVALYRLKMHRPDFGNYIDFVVERNGFRNFAVSVPNNGFYSYFYSHGYYLWGVRTKQVADALGLLRTIRSRGMVDAYGVKLPFVEITMEPILHSVFELELPEEYFYWANLTLQAQINRYKATGKPTAFTEGGLTVPPYYIYEWIVDIYSGGTFTVWNPGISGVSITPVVYTKAAIGMHAIWDNNYTLMLVNYVMKTKTPNGFYEGVDENGNMIYLMTDKTNSIIINAARYALAKSRPLTISAPGPIEIYPGESTRLSIYITHSLPLPVQINIASPLPGINVSAEPTIGTTPLNVTLSLQVANNTRPGTYTLIIKAKSVLVSPAKINLTIIVKEPGYTLKIKALDACGEPAPNVTIILGDLKGVTSKEGTVTFSHVNGTYMLSAMLGDIPVSDSQLVTVTSDTQISLKLKIYKVLINAKTVKGTPAENIIIKAYAGNQYLSTARTNSSGMAILKNIPLGNITINAYTSDGKIELGTWSITVRGDVDVIDPEIVVPEIGKIEA